MPLFLISRTAVDWLSMAIAGARHRLDLSPRVRDIQALDDRLDSDILCRSIVLIGASVGVPWGLPMVRMDHGQR